MRRVLLGGLGIALGVLSRPALAQDFPTRQPAPFEAPASSSTRAARLGVPVAVPDTATGVTPAGLLDRRPIFSSAPTTAPTTIGAPVVIGGPAQLPTPQPLGTPNLTEIRGPVSGGVPISPGTPGVPSGAPSTIPYLGVGETMVPTMNPADCPIDAGIPVAGAVGINRLGACRNPRWWTSGEYLAWWTRSTQLPTLITTSLPASNGILGQPDTIPVLSGSFGQTLHSGARFRAGWWFNDDQCRGIDAGIFFLGRNGSDFTTNTAAYPVLARPFFNVNTPFGPFSEVVGTPGLANGSISTHLDNSLWGAEINYRRYLAGNGSSRLDGLVGFRYLNFSENLSITENFVRTADSPMSIGTPALSGVVNDSFRAVNNFYGGQVGLTGEMRRGKWFANARTTVALGSVQQTATIGGGQSLNFGPGGTGLYSGGLLALPGANIGSFSQSRFAVMPELGLNLGYHITPHLRVFAGYNFLYLSNVLRASGTIDQNVDASRIPNFPLPGSPAPLPGTRPIPQFNTTDFWAQGVSVGLQWSW